MDFEWTCVSKILHHDKDMKGKKFDQFDPAIFFLHYLDPIVYYKGTHIHRAEVIVSIILEIPVWTNKNERGLNLGLHTSTELALSMWMGVLWAGKTDLKSVNTLL